MNNLFQYTKTEGQAWLVEKPEMKSPEEMPIRKSEDSNGMLYTDPYQIELHKDYIKRYEKHLATLRRFKYDYPDPGKEMELGKDFEVVYEKFEEKIKVTDHKSYQEAISRSVSKVALPITQRTYSEQDYWSLVGELKGTLRGIIDFYNPVPKVKESLEKRIKELEALKLNNPL